MFKNPFSFEGRIRRTEYGLSIIMYSFIAFLITLFGARGGAGAIFGILYIPMLWFIFAQGAKRCHDVGNSGWWQLIPFYSLWLLFQDGQPGSNQYGENPKEIQNDSQNNYQTIKTKTPMSTGKIILIIVGCVILFPLLLIVLNGINSYNSMVTMDEGVTAQWKQVEVAYQARMDKTKNLFEIVQSAADFEKGTLKEVMEARSKATSITIDPSHITPEKLAEFEKAQSAFGSSLGRLMAVAEQYPQLQSVQAFRDFQAQYEGMENRIATERRRFNETAQEFNTYIRRFPKNIWAGMFHFEKRAYFESQEGADKAPDIKSMREGK